MKLPASQFPTFPHEAMIQSDDVEALKAALSKGDIALAVLLDPHRHRFDMFGWSFVHFCAGNGAIKILDYIFNVLLKELKDTEDRNAVSRLVLAKSADDELPLHLACQQAGPECIEFLLRLGTNVTSLENPQEAPIQVSALARLQCGMLNAEGSSALHVAVEHSDSRKDEKVLRRVLEALLLLGGASETQKDESGLDATKVAAVYTNKGKLVGEMIAEICKERDEKVKEKNADAEKIVEEKLREALSDIKLGKV